MIDLKQKTALVTGAGRGIGLGCARVLASRGAFVFLNDLPENPDLEGAVREIREAGGQCEGIAMDVFNRKSCERLIARLPRLDILVSAPALSHRDDFVSFDPDRFERVLRGTLTAGFHLGQLAARSMIARGNGGKMIFISSVQGEQPIARCSAYNAAKAGLDHLVRSMAVELFSHRINVNAIAPGWIDTPGERSSFTEDEIRREGEKLPWGRLGMPEEVGYAAAFLASEEADYITGVILPVDGGFRFRDCRRDSLPTEFQ